MASLAVTDTHAFLWYAKNHVRKLGADARRLYRRAEEGQATIYVPTLALVEISEASRNGDLQFPKGFEAWARQLMKDNRFVVLDLTWDVVVKAEELYAIPERGDRLIAATAAHLDLPLITRDPEICAAAGVEVVW